MVLSNDLKKAIAFGLIIGAIISICNLCFAAEEEVEPTDIRIGFSGLTVGSNGEFVDGSNLLTYFYIEPGYHYKITNNSSYGSIIVSSDSVPAVGVSYYVNAILNPSRVYEFDSSSYCYMYFTQASSLTITREKLEGMTGFVDAMVYDLSYSNLNGVLFFVVPIMAISILVALGFYLLIRLLNRIKRARGGV